MGSSPSKVCAEQLGEISTTRCGKGIDITYLSASVDNSEHSNTEHAAVLSDRIDVFVAHYWGDTKDCDTQQRVVKVNEILQKRGLTTWCNAEGVETSIETLVPAINKSQCALLFISKRFVEEVLAPTAKSSKLFQTLFLAVTETFTSEEIVAVIVDEDLVNESSWNGVIERCLREVQVIDLASCSLASDHFTANAANIFDAITLKIGTASKLLYKSLSSTSFQGTSSPMCHGKSANFYSVRANQGSVSSKQQEDNTISPQISSPSGDAEEYFQTANSFLEIHDKKEAMRWLKLAAVNGHGEAQFLVGEFYMKGEAVPQNPAEALQWYRRSALANNLAAHHSIGLCYLKGVGVAQDMLEAIKWFSIAADNSFAKSQYALGQCYILGYGVEVDVATGLQWLRMASKNGYVEAQTTLAEYLHNCKESATHYSEIYSLYRQAAALGSLRACYHLGLCSLHGTGVVANEHDAFKWFKSAASRGLADAQYELANCYADGVGTEQSDTDAVHWCRLAADQRHAKAQYCMGVCFMDGIGVEKNEQKAIDWCRLAADQGDAQAQYFMGNCYLDGIGALKDEREAVKWYMMAADRNYADAQHALGDCYRLGHGVNMDDRKALTYYSLSALQKNTESQYRLGECYLNGFGTARNVAEAVTWLERASSSNHWEAEFMLGECYLYGMGVTQNETTAVEHFRRAADNNHAKAQCTLGKCYLSGVGVDRDNAMAIHYFQLSAAQGYADAQCELSICYLETSDSPDKNCINEAVDWCRLAADQNHPEAQFRMGNFYSDGIGVARNDRKALFWYQKAAEQGHLQARCCVHENGISPEVSRSAKRNSTSGSSKPKRFSF